MPEVGVRAFFNIFLNHSETEVVALCKPIDEVLATSGKELSICQLYTVYEKMLDEAKPDAVIVSSPIHFHVAQAIAAAPDYQAHQLKAGTSTHCPPFIADSWAQIPGAVHCAALTASIAGGLFCLTASIKSRTK